MAANKQFIFDNIDTTDTTTNNPVNMERPHKANRKKQALSLVPKHSNFGVPLSMGKITKSPIPASVLPGLQPNQPVQIKGALNMAQPVIPDATDKQPDDNINPAIRHPAAPPRLTINDIQTTVPVKQTKFKPETTHPASLPTNQSHTVLVQGVKPKLGNYKNRIAAMININNPPQNQQHKSSKKNGNKKLVNRNITIKGQSVKTQIKKTLKTKNQIFA